MNAIQFIQNSTYTFVRWQITSAGELRRRQQLDQPANFDGRLVDPEYIGVARTNYGTEYCLVMAILK